MIYTKHTKKPMSILAIACAGAILLSACADKGATTVMSMKKTDTEKTQITIMTKNSVNLDMFEQAVEEKFPEVDLVQIGNHTSDNSDEFAQRMKNNDLTDIVLTWPLDDTAKSVKGKLIDMVGMEFPTRFTTISLQAIAKDRELYYIPGPSQIQGILYNKTMFEQNNWFVPTNFDEFVALCKKIEETGVRSFQLNFSDEEALRSTFCGFGFENSFDEVRAKRSVREFNEGISSFANFSESAFESFERLIDEGILKPEDLNVDYSLSKKMFLSRECAMINEGADFISEARDAGNQDEFAVMPFFCSGFHGNWGQIVPTQFFGMNYNLTSSSNKDKYQLVLKIMDFISTPEGQLALAGGDTSWVSSLIGYPVSDTLELAPIHKTIAEGRFASFSSLFVKADDVLYNALSAMLKGEMTREEAIIQIDKINTEKTEKVSPTPIATATKKFSLTETGNFVSDIIREYANSDIGLFLDNGMDGKSNGKGIRAKFYKGKIYETDVTMRVLPEFKDGEEGFLHKITLTGENLIKALENSIGDGSFYYFSGLNMTYAACNPPGRRILSITTADGEQIDPKANYTVAALEGSIDKSLFTESENTGKLVKDVVIDAIKKLGKISPKKDNRLVFR